MKREIKTVNTSLGEVQVKICDLSSYKRVYPEYDSIIEICKKYDMSYQDVYNTIIKEL